MNAKEYYAGLLKEAGVADDQQQAFLGLLDNEAVARKLQDDLVAPRLRQDEFSRKMDEVTKADKERETKAQEYYQKTLNEYETYQQALAALGTNPNPAATKPVLMTTPTDAISRKDFDAEMKRRDEQTLAVIKQGIDLGTSHVLEFKEPFPAEKVAQFALEKQLPLQEAYRQFVEPRRAETAKQAREAELKQAREEGARDFASKHKIPVDTAPRDPSPIQNNLQHKPAQAESQFEREQRLRSSFVDAWNTPAAQTSGG